MLHFGVYIYGDDANDDGYHTRLYRRCRSIIITNQYQSAGGEGEAGARRVFVFAYMM